jgi:transposase
MDRYVGLDGHAESCTLGVVGPSGKRLQSMVVETNGQVLVNTVRSIPGRVHLCLEEGELSAWLHELLEPHVEELVVTVPRSTKGRPKDDLRDAFARAEELRIGAIATRVYKAPPHLAALKNAVRAYGMAIEDLSRVKNRLKAVSRSRGVLADDGVYDPESRPRWLERLPAPYRQLAEWLGEELDRLEPLLEKAEAWLLREAKTHPIIRTLQTAPGMGPIRTAQLVAIAANPGRFRTSRQFWSYCGLSIVTRSSSDWKRDKTGHWIRAELPQTRGLTRKRHPLLKAVFKGAATTVIGRMTTHPLHADYQRMLAAGTKPNLARLTLARRIAAIVLSMWKHKEVYDPERHKAVREEAE